MTGWLPHSARAALSGLRKRGFLVERIPELAQRGRARVLPFFKMIDAHLAGREFIAGLRFSIADRTGHVA